jgi:hypothetical protein
MPKKVKRQAAQATCRFMEKLASPSRWLGEELILRCAIRTVFTRPLTNLPEAHANYVLAAYSFEASNISRAVGSGVPLDNSWKK